MELYSRYIIEMLRNSRDAVTREAWNNGDYIYLTEDNVFMKANDTTNTEEKYVLTMEDLLAGDWISL